MLMVYNQMSKLALKVSSLERPTFETDLSNPASKGFEFTPQAKQTEFGRYRKVITLKYSDSDHTD